MSRALPWMLLCSLGMTVIGSGDGRVGAATHRVPASRIGLGTGYRPPPFSARDLNGKTHTLEEYEDQVLVLHFWASWCPYCRSEIPKLKELQRQWASRDVRVLAVSTDADLDTLKRFVDQEDLPYPVIADLEAESPIADQYGISGIPVTYVIAKDGRIFARLNGSSEIIATVERALQPPPPSNS